MEEFEEDNFYAEETRYEALENDEIADWEEGLMAGWEEAL